MWVVNSETPLVRFIEELIRNRTELGWEMLELVSGVYFGGSVTHRFADVMSKHVSRPNIRANVFTCIYISSYTMGKFFLGLDNYTMHYQGAFLLGMTLISLTLFFEKAQGERPRAFHHHVNCNLCCKPLVEPQLASNCIFPRIKKEVSSSHHGRGTTEQTGS